MKSDYRQLLLHRIPTGYEVGISDGTLWCGDKLVCEVEREYDASRQMEWVVATYAGQRIKGSFQQVIDRVCLLHRLGVRDES